MRKTLNLETSKEINLFYFLLPFYRSILFRFVHFDTKSKDKHLLSIIKALNIKKKKERISFVYHYACDFADEFYKDKEMCHFEKMQCLVQIMNNSGVNGCCQYCKYQSNGDCPTKNLACKLFYCETVKSNSDSVLSFNDIPTLKVLNLRQRILVKTNYFSNCEDVISDLYFGLIIGTCRIAWRLFSYHILKRSI